VRVGPVEARLEEVRLVEVLPVDLRLVQIGPVELEPVEEEPMEAGLVEMGPAEIDCGRRLEQPDSRFHGKTGHHCGWLPQLAQHPNWKMVSVGSAEIVSESFPNHPQLEAPQWPDPPNLSLALKDGRRNDMRVEWVVAELAVHLRGSVSLLVVLVCRCSPLWQ
jgi:hypothetical protein